jgi:hypothetical protein
MKGVGRVAGIIVHVRGVGWPVLFFGAKRCTLFKVKMCLVSRSAPLPNFFFESSNVTIKRQAKIGFTSKVAKNVEFDVK